MEKWHPLLLYDILKAHTQRTLQNPIEKRLLLSNFILEFEAKCKQGEEL
jgi:hypothetical protein